MTTNNYKFRVILQFSSANVRVLSYGVPDKSPSKYYSQLKVSRKLSYYSYKDNEK